MKRILYAICVLSILSCTDSKSNKMEHRKDEILKIEQLRVDALLENNMVILTKIMHPDAIHISSNGTRKTTQQWLKGRENSTQQFATFSLNNDAQIRFVNDLAIIDGSYTNSRQLKDSVTPLKHVRYTRFYKKMKDNSWQLISHQATEINNKK